MDNADGRALLIHKFYSPGLDAYLPLARASLKWLARKWETREVVLHSFAHLGADKAEAGFAAELFEQARERLAAVDYRVTVTPFGYFNDILIRAPGEPLARIYKAFE